MAKKTDEKSVLDWASRTRVESDFYSELHLIEEALDVEPFDDRLVALAVPIRLVSFLEYRVRMLIVQAEREDERFIPRILEIPENLGTHSLRLAYQRRSQLTISEIIAYSTNISSTNSLLSTISKLMPDFRKRLASIHPLWLEERESWPLSPLIEDVETTLGTLSELYRSRNEIVHELAHPIVDREKLREYLAAVQRFTEAVDWIYVEQSTEGVPRTQAEMTRLSHNRLVEEEERLLQTVERAKSFFGETSLEATQTAWQKYAIEFARMVSQDLEGGSLYASTFSEELASLTRDQNERITAAMRATMG